MLSEYEIFVRVIQAGSLTAVAREFDLSPAMISKRLRKMENRLGVRLLDRTTRRIAVTDVGRTLFDRATEILASVEEAERFVSGTAKGPGGILRVSAPTSFGRLHLAPHLGRFIETHPDVTLDVRLSDELVDLVADGIDLAVRIAALPGGTLVAERLAPIHRVLCATPAYLEQYGEPRTLEELTRHRLIAAASQTPWRLDSPSGPAVLAIESFIRTNSNEVVREAVLADLGIGLRSSWDVHDALRSGLLRVIMPDHRGARDVGLYAVHASPRLVSPNVTAFISFLTELYGPSPYWDRELALG